GVAPYPLMPAAPAGLLAGAVDATGTVAGRDRFVSELLGFWFELGNAGLAGLNFGASVLPTAVASGFLRQKARLLHVGLLVQPLTPIDKSITTATRPNVARMAQAP